MNFRLFIAAFLFSSNFVFAQGLPWLAPYLKSKSIECTLSEAELKEQITTQLQKAVDQIAESLREKGSSLESILQDRNQVDLGPYPDQPIFDFYVRENVTVVIQSYHFQIQTTYIDQDGPAVEKGLWIPLSVHDTGEGKTCRIERIALKESQRKFLPSVEMILGEPPRIMAADLAQVMDISETPTPEHKLKPTEDSKREARAERRALDKHRRREPRHERHRDRRDDRRHEGRRHRRRADRVRENPAQTETAPPEKSSGCSGDLSPWKALGCAVSGGK